MQHGKNGKPLSPLPMNTHSLCKLCKTTMVVADGSLAYFHGCCKKFRKSPIGLQNHIAKEHATS